MAMGGMHPHKKKCLHHKIDKVGNSLTHVLVFVAEEERVRSRAALRRGRGTASASEWQAVAACAMHPCSV